MKRLDGKTALITGSSSGIGKAIAIGFAREGAEVIVNFRRNRDGAAATAKAIESEGGRCLVVQADVGLRTEVANLFESIRSWSSKLDIVVNNAGVSPKIPFGEVTEEQWDQIQSSNLKSQFLCSQAALPLLRTSRGCILNVSSIHAVVTTSNFACYAASKGGIEAFTRGLAVELGEEGIRVNALRPGWIRVEREQELTTEEMTVRTDRIPLRRAGRVEDLVGMAVCLCSDEGAYITGEVIAIDGGHAVNLSTAYARGHIADGARDTGQL